MSRKTSAGGLGTGPRQREQADEIEEIKTRLRRVEQGILDDENILAKEVRFELDSGDRYVGVVNRVSKFRITVTLTGRDGNKVQAGKEKVLYKSHILWHEVI